MRNIRKIANPLDIVFAEKNHKYFSDYNSNHISVTTLLKKYQKEFPKDMYIKYANKRNLDPNYVKYCWDEQRRLGTEIGSWLHINLENRLQNKVPDLDYLITQENSMINHEIKLQFLENYNVQINKYLQFIKDQTYLGSEVIVGNQHLAGQIDTLFLEGIDDFKNDKVIDFENSYEGWKGQKVHVKMNPPFDDLDDCNWNKYCLQINLYHYLLPEEIKNNFTRPHRIIKFDRYSKDFSVYEVPDMQDRIKQII